MNKKVNVWWENLDEKEKRAFIDIIEEKKAAALAELDLNWGKAKTMKIGKIKMLIPYSEKLQEYYFFNPKNKVKYERSNGGR